MSEGFQDALNSGAQGLNKGVQNAIVDLVERVYRHGSIKSKAALDKLRLRFTTKFTAYLVQTAARCGRVKTLISRTEPINIEDAYVPVAFNSGSIEIIESELIGRLCAGEQFVISGIAGCGKSMTMRFLYLTLCRSQDELIPVFLELRHVGFGKNQDVISYVIEQIANFTHSIERDAFLATLKDRRFVFVLDGFDEIAIELRDRAEKDILAIARDYPLCPIIVSSRPDQRFQRWHSFTEAKICPLSLEQVEQLITKTKFNEPTKINFIKKIRDGLYQSHQELLSNPLLASMMLMTFEEFAEIPSKMHIFYRSAFEVLFRRHDATKVDFNRQFKTDLSIDDFEKVFSSFCLMSYLDSVHSFRNNDAIISYLEKAKRYESADVRTADFRDDLIDNICIVLHDGEQFAFLHRSFQEYFAAAFLASRSVDAFADIIDAVGRKDFNLAVIKFLFEMNRQALERSYIIPRVTSVIADLKSHIKKKNYNDALAMLCSSVICPTTGDGISFSISLNTVPKYFQVINILNTMYRLGLFPDGQYRAEKGVIPELKRVGHSMGAARDRVSVPVEKMTESIVKGTGLNKYLEKVLAILESFLPKKIEEEAGRKTLLSEVLLGARKK